MKIFLVLLVSLMLVVPLLAWGEELNSPLENPTGNLVNDIVSPVEPQEPQNAGPKVGEPINAPPQPEGQPQKGNPGQPQFQPKPQQQMGKLGQKQNEFNKPQMGNQPGKGKYNQPTNQPQGKTSMGKDGQNKPGMLPPLDENGKPEEQTEQEQSKEIPETDGSWVPLKKIGNFFYFWKPKNAPKEEQIGDQQKQPQDLGNTKNNFKKLSPLKKSSQEAFKDDPRLPNEEEQNNEGINQNLENPEGNDENNFQEVYEKDKANTKVDTKTFKNPGEADTAFEKIFNEGNMEIVLVKNMKLVKRTTGEVDEYLWPAHDKIITLSVAKGESIEQNLLAFEYLSKYPSKLKRQGDTLGLPSEGMNSLEATPQFKEGESKEEQPSGEFPAMQVGIPNGTNKENNQQQFTPQAPPGCKVGDKGVPTGFRLLNEGSAQYCDIDEQLHPQKELEKSCQNNFECQSNQCSSGKCLDLNAKMEETQSLLQKILAWLGVKKE